MVACSNITLPNILNTWTTDKSFPQSGKYDFSHNNWNMISWYAWKACDSSEPQVKYNCLRTKFLKGIKIKKNEC